MGKLIVNGNSVYEVDENCMRKRKRRNKDVPRKGKNNQKTVEKNRSGENNT